MNLFIRFCIVGILNTSVNYLVFLIFFRLLDIPYLLAGITGFLSGAVTGFFLNRSWTFQANHLRIGSGLLRYFLVQIVSLLGHTLTLYILTEYFYIIAELSQLFAIATSTLINFFLSRKYVFH